MAPARRSILLTVDYEIFGNGSGDVREHITGPTERMARICERAGVPLVVYVEVEEFLAFERERDQLRRLLGYDPAAEIRTQLVDLARRGHDLQLHLHPEWVGATFRDGQWLLRRDKRSVDSLFETQAETTAYLRDRKAVLDSILAEAGAPQRVTAYRAGAFYAQPGRKLLPALAANGFRIDSSAVRGMVRGDVQGGLDYSAAPADRRHWRVREDVARQDPAGPLMEIPIYSRMGRRFQQLTPKRLLAKFSGQVPKDKQREMVDQLQIGRNPVAAFQFLLQRFPIKLDFHNMGSAQMLRWIRGAPPAPAGDQDAIVLIGHTKEHRDDADFERFVATAARDSDLEVISLDTLSRRFAPLLQAGAAGVAPSSGASRPVAG